MEAGELKAVLLAFSSPLGCHKGQLRAIVVVPTLCNVPQ
jgi:hypothetical protein